MGGHIKDIPTRCFQSQLYYFSNVGLSLPYFSSRVPQQPRFAAHLEWLGTLAFSHHFFLGRVTLPPLNHVCLSSAWLSNASPRDNEEKLGWVPSLPWQLPVHSQEEPSPPLIPLTLKISRWYVCPFREPWFLRTYLCFQLLCPLNGVSYTLCEARLVSLVLSSFLPLSDFLQMARPHFFFRPS